MKVKKIISGISACVLLLASSIGTGSVSAETGHITKVPDGYTPIYTIEDLDNIRNDVENGKKKSYILMNDIDMSETAPGGKWDSGNGWQPIGNVVLYGKESDYEGKIDTGKSHIFRGHFDGNGYKIKNMCIYGNTYTAGLFSAIKSSQNAGYATIENLNLENCNIDIENNGETDTFVGGISATCYSSLSGYDSGYISDSCHVSGKINVKLNNEYTEASKSYIGGLFGMSDSGYACRSAGVENCYNSSDITVTGSTNEIYIGGIVAYENDPYYKYASSFNYNIGKISVDTISEKKYIGEIAGYTERFNYCYYLKNNSNYTAFGNRSDNSNPAENIRALIPAKATIKSGYNFDFDKTWDIDPYCSYQYPQLQSNREKWVEKLEITNLPTKLEYYQGDSLDLTGSSIKITYDDGKVVTDKILDTVVANLSTATAGLGKQKVTVKVGNEETSFEINVKRKIENSPGNNFKYDEFLGDLNGDENIDSKDAVIVLKSYAEILVNGNTVNNISAGDVNEDGNVDSKDAVIILKYYAATLTSFTGDISEFI